MPHVCVSLVAYFSSSLPAESYKGTWSGLWTGSANMGPKKRTPAAAPDPKRRNSLTGPKLSVAAQPSTFSKVAIILLMHLCRKILLVDTTIKLGVYAIAVTCGSLLTDLVPPPRCYLADSRNFLNQYMVKIGWGWTCGILMIFVFVTSWTYCCGDQSMVKKHMSRLFIGTFWWFLCTSIFNYIEEATGFCSSSSAEHFDKAICIQDGFEWIGFDISGHAFLLIHCLLTISEEVKCVKGWERIADVIYTEEENSSERITPKQLDHLKMAYEQLTPVVRGLAVTLVILTFTWEVMLFSTILYFHNMPQKLAGVTFAAVIWFISYRVWYCQKTWSPGLPGTGKFLYMNRQPLKKN